MREILFRGKKRGGGDWVYGNLVQFRNSHGNSFGTDCDHIQPKDRPIGEEFGFKYVVDRNTIGQYTGEKDCMGHKAFTGDKIKYFIGGEEIEGVIIDCGWCFCVEGFYNPCYDYPTMAFSEDLDFTIIGTIHDKN